MKILFYGVGALAIPFGEICASAGHSVVHWAPTETEEQTQFLAKLRWNLPKRSHLFPDLVLSPATSFVADHDVLLQADVAFIAVSSRYAGKNSQLIREIMKRLPQNPRVILVLLSKGVDVDERCPLGTSLEKIFKDRGFKNFAVMSGLSFAEDLAQFKLCAVSVASRNTKIIHSLKKIFSGTNLQLNGTTDITGVSYGGPLKNTYAVIDGAFSKLGPESERESCRSLSVQEMKLILDLAGAKEKTLHSPAVAGDFYGTVNGPSRNKKFGEFIVGEPTFFQDGFGRAGYRYRSQKEIQEYAEKNTVEGYESIKVFFEIAQKNNLDTSLLFGIHAIATRSSSCPELFYDVWFQIAKIRHQKR